MAAFAAERAESGFVVGGTAWDFSHEGRLARGGLDLLVIDEAGQFSLASTIAVSLVAPRLLLLGDPQQLPQVSQGTHPEPVDTSALGWVIGDHDVLPDAFGYFLDRRAGACIPPSRGRCRSCPTTAGSPRTRARRSGGSKASSRGCTSQPVAHQGNATESVEEAARVVGDRAQASSDRPYTDVDTDAAGSPTARAPRPLEPRDIIVVTPYNAQLTRVEKALADAGFPDVPVGTVDKFQGQEAAVAIVSLAASSAADAPRGIEFLLLRNRLNVAISRAKVAAYLVYSPGLLDDLPRTPEGVARLSAFARLVGRRRPSSRSPCAGGDPPMPRHRLATERRETVADELPRKFEIDLPTEVVPGHYADFANVWHTPTVFVMDFVTLAQPPREETDPETNERHTVVPARVVSRIRIPPEQVFELAKALTQQLEFWEQETGKRPPARPSSDEARARVSDRAAPVRWPRSARDDPSADRHRWRAYWACVAVAALTIVDLTKVNVALPSIEQAFSASSTELQLVVSGYVLTFGLALVPAGRIGDQRSRKAMFIIGLSIFTAVERRRGARADGIRPPDRPARAGRGRGHPDAAGDRHGAGAVPGRGAWTRVRALRCDDRHRDRVRSDARRPRDRPGRRRGRLAVDLLDERAARARGPPRDHPAAAGARAGARTRS